MYYYCIGFNNSHARISHTRYCTVHTRCVCAYAKCVVLVECDKTPGAHRCDCICNTRHAICVWHIGFMTAHMHYRFLVLKLRRTYVAVARCIFPRKYDRECAQWGACEAWDVCAGVWREGRRRSCVLTQLANWSTVYAVQIRCVVTKLNYFNTSEHKLN